MSEIIVKITIPKSEYENWGDYEKDGIESVKENIKLDIKEQCNILGIFNFDIEVTHQD